jgi:hypothetical protein
LNMLSPSSEINLSFITFVYSIDLSSNTCAAESKKTSLSTLRKRQYHETHARHLRFYIFDK